MVFFYKVILVCQSELGSLGEEISSVLLCNEITAVPGGKEASGLKGGRASVSEIFLVPD